MKSLLFALLIVVFAVFLLQFSQTWRPAPGKNVPAESPASISKSNTPAAASTKLFPVQKLSKLSCRLDDFTDLE